MVTAEWRDAAIGGTDALIPKAILRGGRMLLVLLADLKAGNSIAVNGVCLTTNVGTPVPSPAGNPICAITYLPIGRPAPSPRRGACN